MSNQAPSVLVVDDDESAKDFVVAAVNHLGYVAVGTNAHSAMDVVKTTRSLRVLLSEIRLNAGSGRDFVRQALWYRPELKVVFMSSGFNDVSLRRTDPVLNKPFDLDHLRNALDSVLKQRVEPPVVERRRTVAERNAAALEIRDDKEP
jgi:DNA-binding NtrC family response regulator